MTWPRALLRDVASCDTENTVVVAALQVFNPKASSSPRTPQPPHHHTITFVANHRCVHVSRVCAPKHSSHSRAQKLLLQKPR